MIDGRTLVERAVGIMRAAACAPIVVVAQKTTPLPALGGDVLVVLDPGHGPLLAIALGMAVIDEDDVIVLACDLPHAAPVVDRLIGVAGPAVAVDPGGRTQPLCARYPRQRALDAIAAKPDERRALFLVDSLQPAFVDATDDELRNVNSPDDLAPDPPLARG